jgi:hypothetical protein
MSSTTLTYLGVEFSGERGRVGIGLFEPGFLTIFHLNELFARGVVTQRCWLRFFARKINKVTKQITTATTTGFVL